MEETKKTPQQKYYEANKEKIAAQRKARYEANKELFKTRYKANKEKQKNYLKEYYQANKEKQKKYNKEYYEKNKKNREQYLKTNKEKISEYCKEYRKNNQERLKEYKREYEFNKLQNDPIFKLKSRIRHLVSRAINNKGYKKLTKTEIILGCTFDEFRKHIETLWSHPNNLDENGNVWMNWNNYGNPKDNIYEPNKTWDYDHITPLKEGLTEMEVIKLNHHTNIQPLCSYVNRFVKH